MYKDYYHLQSEPFSTHPNTSTFFISNTHKDAWYYLLFGIDTHEPFLVLTGEYGMGKTLLCLRLIKVLKEKGTPWVEYIPTTNEGYGGILRRIAANMGISPLPEDEEILQEMLYDRFRADTEHRRFYLIIDDAHELDKTILTKLKFLSTFSYGEFFPIIMIFVGHPSFLQDIRSPALSSLNQRIKRRYHLAAFSLEDTRNYIYFRLLKAGATGIPAFPDETIRKIFEYSGGIPRLINNICDTCLLIGASNHLATITPAIVANAKNLVHGSFTGAESTQDNSSDSAEDAETTISFSEELPATYTLRPNAAPLPEPQAPPSPPINTVPIAQANVPSAPQANVEEYEREALPTPELKSPQKRNLIIIGAMAAASILLMLTGAFLSRLFVNTDNKSAPTYQNSLSTPQNYTVQPSKGAPEIPTLREELTNNPKPEPLPSALPTELKTAAPAVREAPPSRGKNAMPESSEPVAFHPFSLRSSSYQKEDLASKELSELKQLGLTPYLVKADLGDMGSLWRIYIGYYATEEEAMEAKTAYKLNNATVQRTDYACLVGDYSNDSDMLNMFEKLKKAEYSPYVVQKGRNHFRLYLGAFEGKSEAETLKERLQRNGLKTQVVKR